MVEETLGHIFKDSSLLKQAITHPSVETKGDGRAFERLEFLGDRVLGLVIAQHLFEVFPEEWEGDLARRFAAVVCRDVLIDVAIEMGLKDVMALPGDPKQVSDKHHETIWSDGCEAFIGAIYLDAGLEAARELILKYWDKRVRANVTPPVDPKNALQEWSQGKGLPLPTYHFISSTGPDHAPQFVMEARLVVERRQFISAKGQGTSKKLAEKEAAAELMKILLEVTQ